MKNPNAFFDFEGKKSSWLNSIFLWIYFGRLRYSCQHEEEMKLKEEEERKKKELAAKERERKIEKGLISEDDPDDDEEEGDTQFICSSF